MKRVFLIASLMLLFSCGLRVPSADEQAKLEEMGAFPGGSPQWITTGVQSNKGAGGLIPTSYKVPENTTQESIETGFQEKRAAMTQTREDLTYGDTDEPMMGDTEDSPLARINSVCPGMENDVNEAITTTVRAERIRKYEVLARRCPSSWDLWLWLGRDYLRDNKLAAAGRSYERVLVLNPNQAEADEQLRRIRARQNESSSGSTE